MARRAAAAVAVILALAVGAAPAPAVADLSRPPDPPGNATAPVPSAAAPGTPPERGVSWFALPFLFWLPETRIGFAAASGIHFRLPGVERASNVFLGAAYTLNHQSSLDLASELALRGGTLLTTRLRAVNFPDEFYGIGPFTQTSARETYTRRWSEGLFGAEFPLDSNGHLRLGPRLDLRAERNNDVQPGGLIASGAVEGADGFTAVGVGGSAVWDTRDVPLFPHHGTYVEAWYLQYPAALGRNHGFSVLSLEGRWFHPAGGERVIAAAAYVEQAFGAVPFTLLPKLGSSSYLRGWLDGRFRDHLATAAQAELRVPIWDRFWGVGFFSVGEVARDAGAVAFDALRVAGGLGLRFRLTPEGTDIRFDVAESAAGPQVYVLLLEAF